MDIQQYREWEAEHVAARPRMVDSPEGSYTERVVPLAEGDARVLVYEPAGEQSAPLPVFVNLHGGGFVLGWPEVDDVYCRFLADAVPCLVLNMDYILAPENKFPAAVEQCYALLKYLYQHPAEFNIDPQRIAVGGHSAGGNLTASVCLLARQRREYPIACQIIDYAPLDLVTPAGQKPQSGPPLEPEMQDFLVELSAKYNSWYLPGPADGHHPLASPALAPDLAGLPPALVITAEYDVLCAEAARYAARMHEAGVDVTYRKYVGCNHGFTHVGPQEAAVDAWNLMAAHLRKAFGYGA